MKFSRDTELRPVEDSVLKSSMEHVLEPLNRKKGLYSKEATMKIQKILFPPDVAIIKNSETLRDAVDKLAALQEEIHYTVFAMDGHELIKAVETRNMVLLAEMIVRSALLRKESRGCHFREDYPQKNDEQFKRWSYIQKGDKGEIRLWLGPLA